MHMTSALVCGVTGHRLQRSAAYEEWIREAFAVVTQKVIKRRPVRRWICGGALGFDQWALEHWLQQRWGASVVVARPFPSQDRRWTFQQQRRYQQLLTSTQRQGGKVVDVHTDGYAIWKLHKRNEWIVDQSDVMFVCWDGQRGGGTWQCMQYAIRTSTHVYVFRMDRQWHGWLQHMSE